MRIKFFVLTLLICANLIFAQDNTTSFADRTIFNQNILDDFIGDMNSSYHNGLNILGAPLSFSKTQWMNAGLIVGTGLLSFTVDEGIRNKISNPEAAKKSDLMKFGDQYGRGGYALLGSSSMYLGGLIFNSGSVKKFGKTLTESLVLNALATISMKFIIGRSRPYENEGAFGIEGFQIVNQDNSMPSGHTSTAFTISTILSRHFDNTYVSALLYGAAGLTAYQRIYADKHWFSDVFLGAALGIVIGNSVYDANYNTDLHEVNFHISPVVFNGSPGVNFNLSF